MQGTVPTRPFFAEPNCLPVCKLCGIPSASELLTPDGTPTAPPSRTLKQLPSMLTQIDSIPLAMLHQREASGLPNWAKVCDVHCRKPPHHVRVTMCA